MIHVVFSPSAAGILRRVLGDRRSNEKVIDLTDSLDWGPINFDHLSEREDWLDRNAPLNFRERSEDDTSDFAKWDWLASGEERFRKAVSADPQRLIWLAPRSAAEQAGLYWYLDRFGGMHAQMIIVDYPPRGAWQDEVPSRLGSLNEGQIAEFLDECPRVPWDAKRFPADRWRQLVAENTLLRVVRGGVLQSVSEDFLDQFLLANCPGEWTESFRVEGSTLGSIWDAGFDVDSAFLTWRLRELVRLGEIECESDLRAAAVSSSEGQRIRRAS